MVMSAPYSSLYRFALKELREDRLANDIIADLEAKGATPEEAELMVEQALRELMEDLP